MLTKIEKLDRSFPVNPKSVLKVIDMSNVSCEKDWCKYGTYREDKFGMVKCDRCGHQEMRYREVWAIKD
jgi:hypothetical protein